MGIAENANDFFFLPYSQGSELASQGRELANHFKTEGTPVMIGKPFKTKQICIIKTSLSEMSSGTFKKFCTLS